MKNARFLVSFLMLGLVLISGCGITGMTVYNDQSYCEGEMSVASFNIQTFGKAKMEKDLAKENLPLIISEFDMVAIQEIRDKSGTAIEELNDSLVDYDYVISERLGRSSSKEQYALFYLNNNSDRGRKLNVSIFWAYEYEDVADHFERPPYIVYLNSSVGSFSVIVTHVKPDAALTEIHELDRSIRFAQRESFDTSFILLGDFNSDCRYYDENDDELREYLWAIKNDADTTVAANTCTYDRIVTNLRYCDSGVYEFDQELGLTNEDAKVISDHYPVYFWI